MGLKDYEGSSLLGVESSGDEEHSEAVAVEVAEAVSDASVSLMRPLIALVSPLLERWR